MRRNTPFLIMLHRMCALVLIVCIFGCSSLHRMRVDSYLPPAAGSDPSIGRHPIEGYTSPDGAYHEYEGQIRAISADSLHFSPRHKTTSNNPSTTGSSVLEPFDTARNQVQSVVVKEGDAFRTLALVTGIISASLVGLGALMAATWED